MSGKILLILFACLSLGLYSQVTEDHKVYISGVIKDSTMNPVSYAHILTMSGKSGWVSDYYGTFRAVAEPGDTLVISAVPFHRAFLVIPHLENGNQYIAEIILQKQTVDLDEIVIRPFPATYEELKQEFMEIEIDDPVAINIQPYLPTPEELRNLAYPQGGITMKGPVSTIYDQFSREAKSKKLYAELLQKEKAAARYNKVIVARITGLKNDDEIRKFMEFCALQIKFILESSEYELYAAILGCFNDYCERGLLQEVQEN